MLELSDGQSEIKSLDKKNRETMTNYGTLHPKSDVDCLYVERG